MSWVFLLTADICQFDGTILEPITAETDLGAYTTNKFKWKENIYSSIKDAYQMISWLTRNIVNKDKMIMLIVYKTLIRSKLWIELNNKISQHSNTQWKYQIIYYYYYF